MLTVDRIGRKVGVVVDDHGSELSVQLVTSQKVERVPRLKFSDSRQPRIGSKVVCIRYGDDGPESYVWRLLVY